MPGNKHICSKCKKSFRDAYELRRHLKRKRPCVPSSVPVVKNDNSDNVCMFCGRSYSSVYSLKRHQKDCNMAKDPQLLMRLFLQQKKENEKQKKEMDQLKAQVEVISSGIVSSNQQTVINNVTVNNVQNNMYVNVTICSFGNEDLSKLDTAKVMQLLKNHAKDFMPKMIEHVHANPDHPEYHNVFYDPKREKAIVFAPISSTEMSWQVREFQEISDNITEKIKNHIRPGSGPYFDMAAQAKDYETSNRIIGIVNQNDWKTDDIDEMTKNSLTKITKNAEFMEMVIIDE